MKKIGEYTTRGQITSVDSLMKKIQLFDGRFDTGFRVVFFEVSLQDRSSNATESVSAKLSTELLADNTKWDWDDNREIGWALAAADSNGLAVSTPQTIIDPDNLIVEDLYIGGYSYSDAEEINYMIILEKYDITDWQGALAMVRNRSQG